MSMSQINNLAYHV